MEAPVGHEREHRLALHRIRDAAKYAGASARAPRDDLEMLAFARRLVAERARRFQYFDGHLFSDPAWDIMLDLFVAGIERREVPVTNLCFNSNVPDTTVLRWIKTMCAEGLVVRDKDDVDKRRVLVRLSDQAGETMHRYVEEQMAAAEKGHAAARRGGETALHA